MNTTNGRLVAITATLAVAGCAAATSTASTGPATNSALGHPAASVIGSPHAPVRLAKQLIKAAAAPTGAVRLRHAPTTLLRTPPGQMAGPGVIVRYRWWRIAEPWHAAYSWVAHHQAPSLSSEAGGAVGGPKLRDNEKYADFTPSHLPASVNSATLTVAVEPLTARTSAIGAYAVVVRQPPRPAAENVPQTVHQVSVVGRQRSAPGKKVVVTRRTVTGAKARRLVRSFDKLVVRPNEGPLPCPVALDTVTATFRADGHVWVATNGVCDMVTVTRDGHQLPPLQASDQFTNALNAALGTTSKDLFDHDLRSGLGSQVRTPLVRNTPIR